MDEYGQENPKKKRTTKQKIFRVLKIIISSILTILLLYVLISVVCSLWESHKYNSYNYGQKVNVNGHQMVVSITGENNNSTIVFLTGFGSASPVLHYKPLSDALSDKYRVVVMEPFGYGLSDITESERTIQNIVTELHQAVQQLGFSNYYLMAHSIGGMYSLYWSNQYPKEILGFIGFDGSLPNESLKEADIEKAVSSLKKISLYNTLGYQRVMGFFNKKFAFIPLYSSFNYTNEEYDMFQTISIKRSFNDNMINEYSHSLENLNVIKPMKFPAEIPVLQFLSSEIVSSTPGWKENHIAVGSQSKSNEVIILEGTHIYFFADNIKEVSNKIHSFIV